MPNEIAISSILVREGTPFPAGVSVDMEPFLPGWKLVSSLDGYALARIIVKANWNFFYMAGEIKGTAFGRAGRRTFRRALKRIVKNPDGRNYNSLEITGVVAKRFLGIPFVRISANSRHIQKGIGLTPRKDFALRPTVPVSTEEASPKAYTAVISSS